LLRLVPDTTAESPGRFAELLDREVRNTGELAFRTWVAAFAVADRLELSLYSDDRFVRAHAHGAGIPSFGTAALLDALVERELLDAQLRDTCRRRLRLTGAMGLAPEAEQLVGEVEEADWDISPLVARALFDPTAWRDGLSIVKHVAFLRQVFYRAGTTFPEWVARVYDAGRSAVLPQFRINIGPSLLVSAWLTDDPTFAKEVLTVLRQLAPVPDPLASAFALLGALITDAPSPIRVSAVKAAFAAVGHTDQVRLFGMLRFE
jgi:hypothetical protein